MQIAMIGLGRMGINMARRLLKGGHEVVVYNRTRDKIEQMVKVRSRVLGAERMISAKTTVSLGLSINQTPFRVFFCHNVHDYTCDALIPPAAHFRHLTGQRK